MNRRNFLSLIAAAPLVAAVPALAKVPAHPALGTRRRFIGETLVFTDTLVLDESLAGLHMDRCHLIFYIDDQLAVNGKWDGDAVIKNSFIDVRRGFGLPKQSATWVLQ